MILAHDYFIFEAFYPFAPLVLTVLVIFILGVRLLWEFVQEKWRLRRSSRGLCISCGYDLRGSGKTCPECGFPITRKEAEKNSARQG